MYRLSRTVLIALAVAGVIGSFSFPLLTPAPMTGTIPDLDPALLQPGDLAVTMSGLHVLVSLGDSRWIQADPGEAAVITLDARASRNGWLKSDVTLHRWSVLHTGS
ncbi:MAG: hypothetical protein ACKV19_18110 [Verrucomicrobiales bacterium]